MGLKVKLGARPPKKSEYKPIGPRGGNVNGSTITIDGNEGHMAPAPSSNQMWERIPFRER